MTTHATTTHFATYENFPDVRFRDFVDQQIKPYISNFKAAIDLGCGAGGLIKELKTRGSGTLLGVDISADSIDSCRRNPSLSDNNISFLMSGISELRNFDSYHQKFDLLVSYSVFHLIHEDTTTKFNLLQYLSKPGALIAIDALPKQPWNHFLFTLIALLFRIGVGEFFVRLAGPLIARKMPKEYIRELSKLTYMSELKTSFFIDLSYLDTTEFKTHFELLDLKIVQQGGKLTGRKARLTIRRRAEI